MMEEPELEEGEACFKDDASFDPDIAFSYIEDKLQTLLGHHQKDFEGGVSAENLGAKYGGYGSFLPMYQRSPIRLQPKSPNRVQNPHLSRSPNRIYPECDSTQGHAPNAVMASDAPSTRRNESPSPSISASLKLGSSLEETSVGPKTIHPSHKVRDDFPKKVERPMINAVNPTDQKSLKLRIKVGPDRVAQYNAEIYNLGLTSPSSSEGDSQDESDELMLESHVIPNESTANILQTIACLVVSGGSLLSPLSEGLVNLPRENEYSVGSTREAVPNTSIIAALVPQNGFLRGKQNEVEIKKNHKKPQDGLAMNFNDGKQKAFSSDNLEHNLHPFHELPGKAISNVVKESVKDAKVKNKKGNKDRLKGRAVPDELVKDTFLEQTSDQSYGKSELPESKYNLIEQVGKQGAKISKKDVSVDIGQCNRRFGNRNHAYSFVYLDNSEGEGGKSELPVSRHNSIEKVGQHGAKVSIKDVSVDLEQFNRTPANSNRAPSLCYSENSEGEGTKGATDGSSLKVSLNATSAKCNGIGMPDTSKRVSSDGKNKTKASQTSGNLALEADILRDAGSALPENKCSGKKEVVKLSLSQKDTVHTRLDHLGDPKKSTERPFSNGKSKHSTLGAAKAKSDSADKVKVRSSNKRYSDTVTPSMYTVNPPVAAVDTTLAEPVLILDNWVGCDRCQKWRLLPYGIQSNQLPDKWVCSMLDWLSGMNRCDISEDETTKAVQSLYQVPFPENQHNFQTADGIMAGAISSGVHTLDQNPSYHTYDPLRKQKLKEKQNRASIGDLGISKRKKPLQRMVMKDESSRKVGQSFGGANSTSKADLQYPNKSIKEVSKSNKRKRMHMIEGEENPGKKLEEKLTQQAQGKMNKNDSKHMGHAKVVSCGSGVASDLPIKTAKKDGMKKSMQKDVSGGVCNFEINGAELSTKRIKLKDFTSNQLSVETLKNNGSNLQGRNASIKEDNNGSYLHKKQRARASQDEEEFKANDGGDVTKPKVAEPRNRLSGSKECAITGNIENEEKTGKQRKKMKLTVEDIDKLKKDLGCEQLSTTATSSSSKVSVSRKNKSSYKRVRGSPGESVSSSPVRMPYINEGSTVMDKLGKADPGINGTSTTGSPKKFKDMDKNLHAPKLELSSDKRYDFSEKSNMRSVKHEANVSKRDLGKLIGSRKNQPTQREHDKKEKKKLIHPCSAGIKEESLNEEFPRSSIEQISRKLRIDSCQGDEEGDLYYSKHGSRSLGHSKISLDDSLVGDTSKALKGTTVGSIQNRTGHCVNNEAERSVVLDANVGNRNICSTTVHSTLKEAEDVWREAEELRTHADLIKNSGFSSESNDEYFKAALKFLNGATLFEACSGESIKHLEMSPMQMYSAAAKLFRACASDYEKGHEVAAAVLAYKCMEVAYLRVVYCKSSSTNRLLQDMQSSLQMVPQGESPSSSASDVDNFNNLAAADKATLAKGSGTLTVNHVVLPRNRHNLVRLLDFAKDTNAAMEAAKKSQETFSAALVDLGESQNTEAIISLKRVVEYSFQNVEELVRLVLLTFNTINKHGITRV